ncbi:MAG: RNA polymerase sigma factor [Oscillospiraceae bacterium]|nr:RNA polymerase sigma factor [Oscillospiraceae bacterium]
MDNTSVRPADDIERIVEAYGNTLFRVAMGIVGNSADAEDAVQETFIKYLDQKNVFDDSEHKKAWLIRVVINKSKDILKNRQHRGEVNIDEIMQYIQNKENTEADFDLSHLSEDDPATIDSFEKLPIEAAIITDAESLSRNVAHTDTDSGIIRAMMRLPEKFRTVLILHYVEEYGVKEIAKMTGKTISAIKMRLQKARRLLKEAYGKEIS